VNDTAVQGERAAGDARAGEPDVLRTLASEGASGLPLAVSMASRA
jgi:hypothetical protein